MTTGGAGKAAYFGACLVLFLSGAGNTLLLATGILDLIVALCFAGILLAGRSDHP